LADEQGRKLASTSTCESKMLLEKQLVPWAQSESLKFLDELTTSKLREFRASWGNGALTTQRKHHRLNGFFAFCIGRNQKDEPAAGKACVVSIFNRVHAAFSAFTLMFLASSVNFWSVAFSSFSVCCSNFEMLVSPNSSEYVRTHP
jgi:hypothetical protein